MVEDIMNWLCTNAVQIITMFATAVLAWFTIVLANATKKLHQSTERYAKASEELVYVTELSTKATAMMTKIEQLNLVKNMFEKVGGEFGTYANKLPTFYEVIGLVNNEGKLDDHYISEFMNSLAKKYGELIKDILEYEQGSKDNNKPDVT